MLAPYSIDNTCKRKHSFLINNPVRSDEVFKMTGIDAFGCAEKEAVDNLVQDALLNAYIKRGIGREIMLTAKGLEWCKGNCE